MLTNTLQRTHRAAFKPLFVAAVTAGSITNPIPKLAEPVGGDSGVISWSSNESPGSVGSLLALSFWGVGANGTTATARITGWRKVEVVGGAGLPLWVPFPLLALNLTMGTQVGVATALLPALVNFVTTIAASTAFTTAYEIISPGDGTLALVAVDGKGADYIEVDLAVGTMTSVNGAWANY